MRIAEGDNTAQYWPNLGSQESAIFIGYKVSLRKIGKRNKRQESTFLNFFLVKILKKNQKLINNYEL